MTGLKCKLGGLAALVTASVVSLLAGGVLLGSASADGSNDFEPTTTGQSYRLVNYNAGEGTGVTACLVAFGQAPEATVEALNATPGKPSEGGLVQVGRVMDADGVVKSWKLVDGVLVAGELPEGGLPEPPSVPMAVKAQPLSQEEIERAVKAKPLSPEELERLRTNGKLTLVTPEGCTVIDPANLPEGMVPGMPFAISKADAKTP